MRVGLMRLLGFCGGRVEGCLDGGRSRGCQVNGNVKGFRTRRARVTSVLPKVIKSAFVRREPVR